MAPILFCVRRSKPQLIVPETSTPHELKPLSDIDDQGSLRVQVPVLMLYKKKSDEMRGIIDDPFEVIKKGLGKALVFYYPLAGRVFEGQNRKLMVNCNEKGVWFVAAKANIEVEKLGFESFQPPCPYLKKLLQNVPGSKGIYDCPLLHIQVTRFTCGGFVLAIRFNHTMMDSQGFIHFLNSVTELAQPSATSPSILPVWERELLNARPTPLITCTHKEFEESDELSKSSTFHGKPFVDVEKLLKNLCWVFSKKFLFRTVMVKRAFTFGSRELEALKHQCPSSCTTFEALSACLWKCRTVSLQVDPTATVQLTFLVNVRERFKRVRGSTQRSTQDKTHVSTHRSTQESTRGGLPDGYYGNAIVPVAATTTAELLCKNPVGYAVELIREAKNAVSDDYVKSVADLMVLKGRPKLPFLRNFLIVDNTRFGFDEVDFGWGRPVFGGVVSVGYGVGYLVPRKRMEDKNGVLVALALPPLVMGKFQNEIRKMIRA